MSPKIVLRVGYGFRLLKIGVPCSFRRRRVLKVGETDFCYGFFGFSESWFREGFLRFRNLVKSGGG